MEEFSTRYFFEREESYLKKIAPRGSGDDARSAIGKKVSIYIGFQYVVTFEKEKSYFKNSATKIAI